MRFRLRTVSFLDENSQRIHQKRLTTNLAKHGGLGLRFFALVRAAVLLALALSLGSELDARAAPAPGGVSTDNPFTEGSGGTEAGSDVGRPPGKPAPSVKPAGTAADRGKQERAQLAEQPGDEAESSEGGEADDGEDNALHGLACLEGDATGGRRKGVQRRDFLKRHRFELAAVGGWYASDVLSSTYDYGGALAFFPSEDFGLEVLVTRSPIRYCLEEPFSSSTSSRAPLSRWGRLARDLLAALVAHSRQAQKFVHATSSTGTSSAGGWRRTDLPRKRARSHLGGGRRTEAYLSRFVTFRLDRRFCCRRRCSGRGRITNNVTIRGSACGSDEGAAVVLAAAAVLMAGGAARSADNDANPAEESQPVRRPPRREGDACIDEDVKADLFAKRRQRTSRDWLFEHQPPRADDPGRLLRL